MKTYLRAGVLSLALAACGATGALAQTQPAAADQFHATTASLSAWGETRIAPDMASIHLGVVSEAKTAAEALSANSARMNQVLAALKAAGIPAKDIQTSGLNLNPQQVYVQNEPPRVTGYQASEQVTVQVRSLPRLGAAVDATVNAGANQVNGISFSLADPTAAENVAREQAVRALQAKADLYARATGYRVLRLVSLSEGGGVESPRPPMPLMASAQARMQNVPVAPGELTVRVEVSGLYELTR
jgi:uncharacterized protein YggE